MADNPITRSRRFVRRAQPPVNATRECVSGPLRHVRGVAAQSGGYVDWCREEDGVRPDRRKPGEHAPFGASYLTGWTGLLVLAVAVGVVYFVAARLSLALLTKPEGVAVFWPASGVAAGVVIALGPRARWPVVIGTMAATIVANLFGDRNLWSAVLFGLCNAGEAVLTAWVVQRYFAPDFRLVRVRNVL